MGIVQRTTPSEAAIAHPVPDDEATVRGGVGRVVDADELIIGAAGPPQAEFGNILGLGGARTACGDRRQSEGTGTAPQPAGAQRNQ